MPNFIEHLTTGVIRKNPLGPATLNQLQQNVKTVDALSRGEHFADGRHNAKEIPWVLGHVNTGTTGFLFDTAFGGGTITRPATGDVALNVASGVIGDGVDWTGALTPAACVLANPSDSAVATYPHLATAEIVSATSIKVRTRYMTSTLGSPGNSWSDVVVAVDVAVHAQKQPHEATELATATQKVRRDFLTEAPTDWNTLVRNQGGVRKLLMLEHEGDGEHSVNRVAKAVLWARPTSGPAFTITDSDGVLSVERLSVGVVRVKIDYTLSSTSLAACFPQAQPAAADELVIINGYCNATNEFTFYIYSYSVSEDKWARADRPFFASMFGQPA